MKYYRSIDTEWGYDHPQIVWDAIKTLSDHGISGNVDAATILYSKWERIEYFRIGGHVVGGTWVETIKAYEERQIVKRRKITTENMLKRFSALKATCRDVHQYIDLWLGHMLAGRRYEADENGGVCRILARADIMDLDITNEITDYLCKKDTLQKSVSPWIGKDWHKYRSVAESTIKNHYYHTYDYYDRMAHELYETY